MAFITGFLPFVSVFKLKRIDGKKRSAALKIIGKTNTRFGDVISPDIANIELQIGGKTSSPAPKI